MTEISRTIKHNQAVEKSIWELMIIAQRLCPGGEWVLQIFAYPERNIDGKEMRKYMATVTNGDDNVTAVATTLGAALALLIHYLLDGSVYPLASGNGGRKTFPGDTGWVRVPESEEEDKRPS